MIDDLRHEHAEVLARIAEVADQFTDAAVCAGFLDFLARDVMVHFETEETALFPQLARIPSIADGPLRVMQVEHEQFRALLDSARRARQAGDRAQMAQRAADLAGLLQAHIAKEDGVLFPIALDLLGEAQLEDTDRRARAVRSAGGKGTGGRP